MSMSLWSSKWRVNLSCSLLIFSVINKPYLGIRKIELNLLKKYNNRFFSNCFKKSEKNTKIGPNHGET